MGPETDHRESDEMPPPQQPTSMSLPHEIAFVAMICSAQLLTQACLAQSIAPLHIIGPHFGVRDPPALSWMTAAYSLTVGTFILPAGRLGDVFGHRRIFLLGYCWLSLWSLVAGLSVYVRGSPILFDLARAGQGIGPALLLPNAIAILGRTYAAGPRKDWVFSIFGSTAPGGFVIGALFSSLFAQLAWWPWTFFTAALVTAGLAGASTVLIPRMPVVRDQKHVQSASLVQRLDVLGMAVGVTGLVLVNFAWNQGPLVGWPTVYVDVLLVVGLLFIAAFFWIEARAEYPLVPVHAMSAETGFVLACVAAGWSAFGIWLYYLWQFMEVLRMDTPLQATAYCIPVALSGLCAALTTGKLLSVISPGCVMVVSMSAFMAGTVVLATLPVNRVYWAGIFVSCIIMPWGMDMSFPSGCIILSNSMSSEHQGIAASLVNTAVNYSISIGLGLAGTVDGHVNKGGTDLLRGYRGAWYLGIGLGALGFCVAVCFMLFENRKSRGKKQTAFLADRDKGSA